MLVNVRLRDCAAFCRGDTLEGVMLPKSAFVMTIATAITVAALQPAAAASAPQPGPAIAMPSAQDFSAVRKRRGHGRGFPVAAFGAIVGTIAGIAAAERRREYYERPYGYYAPGYVYAPAAAHYGYAPAPHFHHHGGFHGGHVPHGGYHGGYVPHGGPRHVQPETNLNPSPGH